MKVIVETGSNYKNCNGKQLEVVEINGCRVTCKIPRYGFDPKSGVALGSGVEINTDFTLKEVVTFVGSVKF